MTMCPTRETLEADPGFGVVQQSAGITSLAYHLGSMCKRACWGTIGSVLAAH
jgi:hypothetical protein